jgi:hypothetical protein
MDSPCELLRSLDAASGSVHRCEVPCRTARSTSKGVTYTETCSSSLRLSGGLRLTENTREARVAPLTPHAQSGTPGGGRSGRGVDVGSG